MKNKKKFLGENLRFVILVVFGILIAGVLIFYLDLQNCKKVYQTSGLPYNLNMPEDEFVLPGALNEISGLCFFREDTLLCVQDEKAIVFKFDFRTGKVTDKYNHKKQKDFEGIAVHNDTVWLLTSSGNIYQINDFTNEDEDLTKIETPLSVINNCEGLTYDAHTHSLLIACKGNAAIKGKQIDDRLKAIYRFDLTTNRLIAEPYILIDVSKALDLDSLNLYDRVSYKLTSFFSQTGDIRFQPSGIAVHPLTNKLYIVASVGDKLMLIDRNGNVEQIYELDNVIHKQPEGICFDKKGNMFISNEARGGKAKIFKYKNQEKCFYNND